ncbi:hypothetical protein COLO4_17609 [Corchorus olitorius]|uniref:Bromo domain-containing protein n=1 Tax=Corchorus olitorius TaxID=93759 RepID=A0A1R3JC69_9ROSI|nr:hypothetical protein COLO4_17609 [Corchorus olitorius]
MDLGTVKTRLNTNWYKSPREFAEDVRLTFSNAMLYNPKEQDAHFMAKTLLAMFEEKWKAVESEYNPNRRVERSHDPTSRRVPAPDLATVQTHATTPAPAPLPLESRTLERSESMNMPADPKSTALDLTPTGSNAVLKKPKTKDPEKRDMTYEEKHRLSVNLQNLPTDKLDGVIQIIKKRNPALCQEDEEIELDIDIVDRETLWELDRYVTNYKKSLSKNKKNAEPALQASIEDDQSIQKTNLEAPLLEVPKVAETVDSIVPPSPIHGERQQNNEIQSSSSSSSGSDSGSSSSGTY